MHTGCTGIGERIRTLRRARKMSRAELSEAVGISESHIGKMSRYKAAGNSYISKNYGGTWREHDDKRRMGDSKRKMCCESTGYFIEQYRCSGDISDGSIGIYV